MSINGDKKGNSNLNNMFQDTLNLPKTDFSQRARSKVKEPELLNRWNKERLYEKSQNINFGNDRFVLHDGPPYANGNIHLGHVLNKVLKDIVGKYKRMSGYQVPIKPGWDCHGLPIELQVIKNKAKELKDIKDPSVRNIALKKACRDYAQKWVNIQRDEFKDLGILMDWDHPYVTMSKEYEAEILRAFSIFVEKDFIERKNKTVPWCPSCQTVLASAEIEYKDREGPSIYVLFPLSPELQKKLFPSVPSNLKLNFLIWTTTPWTLPLNRAVVLKKNTNYVVIKNGDKSFIVAEKLADAVCQKLGIDKNIISTVNSSVFEQAKAKHPFIPNFYVPVILDDSVLLSEGTACVHSAPGCGPEDYVLGVKNSLEIFSPLSKDGRYTEGIRPEELKGMSIKEGQSWVLKRLEYADKLLYKGSIIHSYPHCWRCHKGLMFRATEQWFCNLNKDNLEKKAVKAIDQIKFYPSWGKNRLKSFVDNRTEWCISRQRTWGVPIPAIKCLNCENAYMTPKFIRNIADKVQKEGVEYWDKVTIQELVNDKILPKDFECPLCGNKDLNLFEKEKDILDVWFDSGVSNYAVLKKFQEELKFPADLYLEGSDQHRGWFQSSLLSSIVVNDSAPVKTIVTHGFTVDKDGRKMSKSIGNVISPNEIIKKFSRDILRLLISSSDYQNDISFSKDVFDNVLQAYKKIRNSFRFILSNLYDFDYEKDSVNVENLLFIDKFALSKLNEINNKILSYYDEYNFSSVFHTITSYFTKDLSSLYFDVSKDRLYTEKPNSLKRRSAQTTMYIILDTMTRLIAPILSFLSEEVSDFYQKEKKHSIHLQRFAPAKDIWTIFDEDRNKKLKNNLKAKFRIIDDNKSFKFSSFMKEIFNIIVQMRESVLKAIEEKRKKGTIKHSLEAKVIIYVNPTSEEGKLLDIFYNELSRVEDKNSFFKDWFIVSQVEFVGSDTNLRSTALKWLFIKVEHADGTKCPRCWQWSKNNNPNGLCTRCYNIIKK